ncbi:uncharacterized protein PFB0765w-like [Lucilia sericata]|uniref:uncharacterized protein PFB0765w-like n=1 Tax=Lucilia sericata TaxID=13632 RepID=UPI0018A82386|nr:uncharacterized protein PFB0765w-like [Lucilia sericata]
MDLQNIPIEKQVNLILLSKVLKNNLDLKKKTNLSLYQIHRILQNQDVILEVWKERNKKIKKTPDYTVAVETLLLEWIRQCKLKKVNLSITTIHEQINYLKELFKIFYKINMKIWTRIRTILGDLLYNNVSTDCIPFDIYAIFQKEGKRLLKAEIYEEFLERLDVKAIRSNSKKSIESKSPKTKAKPPEESKIENKDDDEVIAVENPITVVDISNDDTEFYDKITKIKSEPLSPTYSVRQDVIKETIISSKDIETTEIEQTKEVSIKKEPQANIETENLINSLEEELNEFEEFIDIPENPRKTLKLEPDNEKALETRIKIEAQECDNTKVLVPNIKLVNSECNKAMESNIKIEPPELNDDILQVEHNELETFLGISNDQQTESANEKIEDISAEIKRQLDFDFMDDNDSECIDIYQIVDNNEEDDKGENECSTKNLSKKETNETLNGIGKKPIEIEFSDFDCLQIILKKNCDKSLKEILKEVKNKTNETAEVIKKTEEENEETQIELDIEDGDFEDLQNELEKNCEEENKTAEVMEEDEEENEETQIELEIEDCEEDVQNELREIINKYAKENKQERKTENPLEIIQQEEKRLPTEKDEDDYEIVFEIVSDEEVDANNAELNRVIDLLKTKQINESGKRRGSQTADETSLLNTPSRKMPRLNSNQSEDLVANIKSNDDVTKCLYKDFKSSNVKKRRRVKKRTF